MYSLNVLGAKLQPCSVDPLTGFFRDGCCNTDATDIGSHTVCCVVTENFLHYSKEMGNDLITPREEYNFPGLKPGDRWCLCAARWEEARQLGKAPKVLLSSTNIKSLEIFDLENLKKHEFNSNSPH